MSGKQVGRGNAGEGSEWETVHQDEEGGKEEEGESASADLHHRTAEPDAQVSLQIFTHSISRRFSAYTHYPLHTQTYIPLSLWAVDAHLMRLRMHSAGQNIYFNAADLL